MQSFLRSASRLRAHSVTQLAVTGLLSALVGFTLQLTKLSALDASGRQYDQGTYAGKVGFLAVFGISKAFANLGVGWLVTRLGYVRTEVAGWLLGLAMPLLLLLGAGSSTDAAAGWHAVMGANVVLGLQQGLCWSVTVLLMILILPDTRRGLASGLNETLGYVAVASAAPVYGILESRMVRCGWAVPPAALSAACQAAAAAALPPPPLPPSPEPNATAAAAEPPPPALLDPRVCTSPDTWHPGCLGECRCRGYDRLLESALLVLLPAGLAVTALLLVEPSPGAAASAAAVDATEYLPVRCTGSEGAHEEGSKGWGLRRGSWRRVDESHVDGSAEGVQLQPVTHIQDGPRRSALRSDGYAALPTAGPSGPTTASAATPATIDCSGDASRQAAASVETLSGCSAAVASDDKSVGSGAGGGPVRITGSPAAGPSKRFAPLLACADGGGWLASVQLFGRAFLYYTWRNPSTAAMCLAGATSNALTGLAWGLVLTWARDALHVPGLGRNLLTATYSFLKGLVQLLSGAVSDSVGRKAPVVLGLLLNCAGLLTSACGAGWGGQLLGAALPPPQRVLVQFGYLLLGSCLMGSGAGVFYPVMPAAVVDHHVGKAAMTGARDGDEQEWQAEDGSGRGMGGSRQDSMAAAMATFRFWRDLGYALGALTGPMADVLGVEGTLVGAAVACLLVAVVVGVCYEERTPGMWSRVGMEPRGTT